MPLGELVNQVINTPDNENALKILYLVVKILYTSN